MEKSEGVVAKAQRLPTNDFKPTKAENKVNHVRFCSNLKENKHKAKTKCSPIPQNVFLLNQKELKPK